MKDQFRLIVEMFLAPRRFLVSLAERPRWGLAYVVTLLLLFAYMRLDLQVHRSFAISTLHGWPLRFTPLVVVFTLVSPLIYSWASAAIIAETGLVRDMKFTFALAVHVSVVTPGLNAVVSRILELTRVAPAYAADNTVLLAPSAGDIVGPYRGGATILYDLTAMSVVAFAILYFGITYNRPSNRLLAAAISALCIFGPMLLTPGAPLVH